MRSSAPAGARWRWARQRRCSSLLLSLLIGLFSLRVKAIFFAMITLAVASAFLTLASQLSDFSGGEDRLNFKVPEALQQGRLLSYYLPFGVVTLLFQLMLRIVNSPFGRVLQAMSENDFPAEAIGCRTVVYRTLNNVLASLFARLAGVMLALWLRYTGPDTALSPEIMRDILLIVVIGSVLFVAGPKLPARPAEARRGGARRGAGVVGLVSPDRWLLWLGVLFILLVYHLPSGLVGRLRAGR